MTLTLEPFFACNSGVVSSPDSSAAPSQPNPWEIYDSTKKQWVNIKRDVVMVKP